MKKYISILMLAPLLGVLSCDRETANNKMMEDDMQRIPYNSSQYKSQSAANPAEEVDSLSNGTGDDDEPQDDKQHWKTANDSVAT